MTFLVRDKVRVIEQGAPYFGATGTVELVNALNPFPLVVSLMVLDRLVSCAYRADELERSSDPEFYTGPGEVRT